MGLFAIFLSSPTPRWAVTMPNDCLASGIDVNMLDSDGLLANETAA